MRRDGICLGRVAMGLAGCAAGAPGCGGPDEPAAQVLRLSVVTAPGLIEFHRPARRAADEHPALRRRPRTW